LVGYTSIKTADAEIEGGNGSVARDPGAILTEHMYNMATLRPCGFRDKRFTEI
jgi:hypothetical protein